MSQISYQYSRDSYLTQVFNHARTITGIIAKQFDANYIDLLKIGTPGKAINNYFKNHIDKYNADTESSDFFIVKGSGN